MTKKSSYTNIEKAGAFALAATMLRQETERRLSCARVLSKIPWRSAVSEALYAPGVLDEAERRVLERILTVTVPMLERQARSVIDAPGNARKRVERAKIKRTHNP